METVYLALGSNVGDKEANLEAAISKIGEKCTLLKRSSIYQTPPWGYQEQDFFLNMVVSVHTELNPVDLLAHLKSSEINIGRQPTFRNGPRVIDIDILFYGQQVLAQPGLEIPHPRLHERAFVLVPLAEIAPDLIHPTKQCPVDTFLVGMEIKDILLYKKYVQQK